MVISIIVKFDFVSLVYTKFWNKNYWYCFRIFVYFILYLSLYIIYDYCIAVLVSVSHQSKYRQFINSLKTYDHDKLFHFVWNGKKKAVPHKIYMWHIIVGKIFQYQPNISYNEELLWKWNKFCIKLFLPFNTQKNSGKNHLFFRKRWGSNSNWMHFPVRKYLFFRKTCKSDTNWRPFTCQKNLFAIYYSEK